MTIADIVILIVILISLLLGLWRGFVKEAFSLASWIAAVLVAVFFGAPLAELFTGVLDNAMVRRILASSLLFILVMFVGAFIGNIMSKLSAKIGLRGVDMSLGSLFGLLRGVIIVLLVLFLTVPFQFSENWYRDSVLVPRLMIILNNIESMLDYRRTEPGTEVESVAVT